MRTSYIYIYGAKYVIIPALFSNTIATTCSSDTKKMEWQYNFCSSAGLSLAPGLPLAPDTRLLSINADRPFFVKQKKHIKKNTLKGLFKSSAVNNGDTTTCPISQLQGIERDTHTRGREPMFRSFCFFLFFCNRSILSALFSLDLCCLPRPLNIL